MRDRGVGGVRVPLVLWVTPSGHGVRGHVGVGSPSLCGSANVMLLGLRAWSLAPGDPYGLPTEVDAVISAAAGSLCTLFGFSAGGTVAQVTPAPPEP
jgi:hypothetical protein